MKLIQGDKQAEINTISNWPLIEDLFIKWGYPISLLEAAKTKDDIRIKVSDMNKITSELSAWGIPWKRTDAITQGKKS